MLRLLVLLLIMHVMHGPKVFAADRLIIAEAKMPFCQTVHKHLIHERSPQAVLAASGVTIPAFQGGKLYLQKEPGGPIQDHSVAYAAFDIDNDGKDEVLISYFAGLRGHIGELLWILRDSTGDLGRSSGSALSDEQFARLEAIESMTPWAYERHGLFLVELVPFKHNDTSYIALKDLLFGNPAFPERTFIIAKYSGKRLGEGGFGHITDDINILCKFKFRHVPRPR